MENILPVIVVVLLCLLCPLGMAVIGGIAWLIARATGRKGQAPTPRSM